MKTMRYCVAGPALALAGLAAIPQAAEAQCCLNPVLHKHGELTSANLPAAGLSGSANLGSFSIVITPEAELAANPAALAAFERAASRWEQYFSDPVSINITANLTSVGFTPGIIGGASPVILSGGYTTVRNQLLVDAAGEPDDGIVAFLPTAAEFSILKPTAVELSGDLSLTKANAKAMGFAGLDGTFGISDGAIRFNSAFAFDFDNSDGVGDGLIDFETVAAHEIGHLLGFISEVDTVEIILGLPAPGPGETLPEADIGVLDLFRFSDNDAGFDPATPAEFASFPRTLVPGDAAVLDDIANEWLMSTGLVFGDGRQASHWKDDALTGLPGPLIGIMDPTLAQGGGLFPAALPLTYADLRALDLIGYDYVPEPGSLALVLLAGLALRRRRMN